MRTVEMSVTSPFQREEPNRMCLFAEEFNQPINRLKINYTCKAAKVETIVQFLSRPVRTEAATIAIMSNTASGEDPEPWNARWTHPIPHSTFGAMLFRS